MFFAIMFQIINSICIANNVGQFLNGYLCKNI